MTILLFKMDILQVSSGSLVPPELNSITFFDYSKTQKKNVVNKKPQYIVLRFLFYNISYILFAASSSQLPSKSSIRPLSQHEATAGSIGILPSTGKSSAFAVSSI